MKKVSILIFIGIMISATSINLLNAQVANVPTVKLNNGLELPRFGLGTFMTSKEDCKQACLVAFRNGYRHVDTAHAYGNESGVGEAIKDIAKLSPNSETKKGFVVSGNVARRAKQDVKKWLQEIYNNA